MNLVQLDTQMLTNPTISSVGALGFAVHVAGIGYSVQHLTDGFVPRGAALTLVNFENVYTYSGRGSTDRCDTTVISIIERGTPGYFSLQEAGLWIWDAENRGWWLNDAGTMWRIVRNDDRPWIPTATRVEVFLRDGYRCLKCGSAKNLHIDHVIPWSRGGEHSIDNFQTLCAPCNIAKGATTADYRPSAGATA